MNLQLKELNRNESLDFWNLAFSKPDAEWTKWNGPYFHDKLPEKQKFIDLVLKIVMYKIPCVRSSGLIIPWLAWSRLTMRMNH